MVTPCSSTITKVFALPSTNPIHYIEIYNNGDIIDDGYIGTISFFDIRKRAERRKKYIEEAKGSGALAKIRNALVEAHNSAIHIISKYHKKLGSRH